MQFKTLRSDKEGAKLFNVLAKSCFSIEIKLSHQLYSLAQFIIPGGKILTPIFSAKLGGLKLKWRKIHIPTFTFRHIYATREAVSIIKCN